MHMTGRQRQVINVPLTNFEIESIRGIDRSARCFSSRHQQLLTLLSDPAANREGITLKTMWDKARANIGHATQINTILKMHGSTIAIRAIKRPTRGQKGLYALRNVR